MSDPQAGPQQADASSSPGCLGIVVFLVVTPVCLVVAFAMLWLGSFRATTFDGPIPLTSEELWTGRMLVICAGLLASAPFAVAAWKLRKDSPLAFSAMVIIASLIAAGSLGLAFALPFSSDYTVF